MSADDWKQLAAQMVMLGRKAGTMPAGLQGALAQSREARVRWQDELREFIERTIPTRRSWSRPNRRMLGAYGIVLPGTIKENCPELTVIVDTSGSTRSFLPTFADEFIGLAQTVLPSKITVISCDAEIHAIHTYEPDEYGEMKFDTSGGGGTAMSPAFDWINDQWEQPTAVIVLTDLEIDHPREPDYPVMFVTPEHCRYEPPFGRAIRIPPAH
jgi:predicted metal-dependent peptidase